MEQLMSTSAVAKRLGCSKQWVLALAREGKLPAAYVEMVEKRKRWMFYASDVERFAAQRDEARTAA